MFKKILLPLDGSARAEGAIPWAIRYAAPSGTPIVLTRVLDKVYPLEGMPFGAEADEASLYLKGVERTLSALGVPTEITLPVDPVAPSIVSAARRARCNLIIMTTRGSSRIVRRLIGGVTEHVIRTSPVPVLVVRSQDVPQPLPEPPRILVPVDGSPGSKHVLAWAERLARFHKSPTEILYVQPGGKHPSASEENRSEEIGRSATRLCRMLRARGVAASYRLERGDPAKEILKACGPNDLIVMTTHGHGGLKHLVKGSVAERVLRGAPRAVLVSKHGLGVPAERAATKGPKAVRAAGGDRAAP